MESPTDPEKQHLIEDQEEPLGWTVSLDEDFSRPELGDALAPCRPDDAASVAERDARRVAGRKLFIACALTLVFMIGEVIGGYAAHSLAIMTDAAHLLTDFGSILISIFSLWISSRPRTQTMTFGWHRAEILGMLLSVVTVWALTAALLLSAVQRIRGGDYDIDSRIMLVTSGCAVGINVLMVLILHQSGASHGHSHGGGGGRQQQLGDVERRRHGNASVRAAFVHVVGDLLQSVGVLVAAAVIYFWPECKVADPICTFLFSVLVLGTTFPVTKDVLRILMEGSPQGVDFRRVRDLLLLSVGGVVAVHSLNMWSLNMSDSLLSVHVVTDKDADSQIVLTEATRLLCSEFGFSGITIQVERYGDGRSPTVETDTDLTG